MKKVCFVISPIGEPTSATRLRANQIYTYVIEPVLGEAWKVERADRISEPGIITNQIIDRLIGADLVIADLSERNPNVFYELAVRHIVRRPYVHLIAHDEDIPFDNAPVRAIKVDVKDLDSVDAAKKELRAQIDVAMLAEHVVESPISVSLTLAELRKSGDQEGVVLQSLMSELSALKRQVSQMASAVTLLGASLRPSSVSPLRDAGASASLADLASLYNSASSRDVSNGHGTKAAAILRRVIEQGNTSLPEEELDNQ